MGRNTSFAERGRKMSIATLARQGRLEQARARACSPHATLDDYLELLDALAVARTTDLTDDPASPFAESRALGAVQGSLQGLTATLRRVLDPQVRSAPPAGLTELLADAGTSCPAMGCVEHVWPWTFDGQHCSAEHRDAVAFAYGEVAR